MLAKQVELFPEVVSRPRRRPRRPRRLDVLRAIRMSGERGMTADEVERATRLPHQTASARVHELARAGVIVASGERPTRSGRPARVWRAAPAEGSAS